MEVDHAHLTSVALAGCMLVLGAGLGGVGALHRLTRKDPSTLKENSPREPFPMTPVAMSHAS